jgi:mitochondrial fission protein ELM1
MPRHDRPPLRKNVVITEGALNLIDEEYLKEQTEKLLQASGFRLQATGLGIGLLIGGDAKKFTLRKDVVFEVIRQIKQAAEKLDADILVTTSRRSSRQIEDLVIKEFSDCRRCKLLVIANQNNIPEAVGGILGLSQIVISSPESITMISEAATTSRAYVFVFQAAGLNRKHRNFLDNCAKHKYIYLTQALNLDRTIGDVWSRRPQIYSLQDNLVVAEAIKKTL